MLLPALPGQEDFTRSVAYPTQAGTEAKSGLPNFEKLHLPSLDGIRAVAVLLVVEFHYFNSPYFPRGASGVLLFFVLSGFLITRLLLAEKASTGTVNLRAFYLRRARRILPALYVACPFSIAAWILAGNPFRWAELGACLGFVSNYYYILTRMSAPNALPVTWSLAIEEQFYLLWPVLFLAFRRSETKLIRVLVALIAAGWFYRLILAFVFNGYYYHLYYGFDTRYDHLLTGCLLAILTNRYSAWQGWRWILSWRALAIAAGLFAILIEAEQWITQQWRFGVVFALEPLLAALLLVQSVALADSAARWLNWSPMRFLGRISYSVYLFHLPCLWIVARQFSGGLLQRGILAFGLTLLVSSFSYYFVETPLRQRSKYT